MVRQMSMQQQQMDDRRRAMMNEMYSRGTTSTHGVTSSAQDKDA